jgi:hypothetical protein
VDPSSHTSLLNRPSTTDSPAAMASANTSLNQATWLTANTCLNPTMPLSSSHMKPMTPQRGNTRTTEPPLLERHPLRRRIPFPFKRTAQLYRSRRSASLRATNINKTDAHTSPATTTLLRKRRAQLRMRQDRRRARLTGSRRRERLRCHRKKACTRTDERQTGEGNKSRRYP